MKINSRKVVSEQWKEVELEDCFESRWKKLALYKDDVPSKRVKYEDPDGNYYKNFRDAMKKFSKLKIKAEKAERKQKEKENKCKKGKRKQWTEASQGQEAVLVSPSKRKRKNSTKDQLDDDVNHDQEYEVDFLCGDCKAQFDNANLLADHISQFHKVKAKLKVKNTPHSNVKNLPRNPEINFNTSASNVASQDKLKKHKKKEDEKEKAREGKGPAPAPSSRSQGPPGPPIGDGGVQGSISAEVFYCEECGVEYQERSQLSNHMMSSHPELHLSPQPVEPIKSKVTKNIAPAMKIPELDYDSYEEDEDDEEFDDPDIVELEIPSGNLADNITRGQKPVKPMLEEEDSSEEENYSDFSDYEDEEKEPEEITLDDDDEEEDDDIIIEDIKLLNEEKERNSILEVEDILSESHRVLKIIEDPSLLEQLERMSWWAQPIKWKPNNTWEVWNAKVQQVCAHYKVKDVKISPGETFSSYDDFDRIISPRLLERNPAKSFKILYTWKKAKWFSLLDPVIPDNMKIVEETLEDDD